jgi:hypothetical protein
MECQKGKETFLVSPLSSLGFSRYDSIVEPQSLEPGEGLANVSPQCLRGFLTEPLRAAFYHRCTL